MRQKENKTLFLSELRQARSAKKSRTPLFTVTSPISSPPRSLTFSAEIYSPRVLQSSFVIQSPKQKITQSSQDLINGKHLPHR